MSTRMKALLAVLLGIGLLMAFDGPAAPEVVEVAERVQRAPAPRPAEAPRHVLAQAPFDPAAPLPDLFAGGGPDAAQEATEEGKEEGKEGKPAAAPFRLLGFKDEDGVREAFLMRGDAVLLARAGVLLEQRYRVLALRQDTVHIQDKQTGAQHRIGFEVEQ